MNINAVIKKPQLIIANTTSISKTQSQNPIELKNNISSISQNYLHNLLDVVEDNPQNGYTLVYNANTGKYDVAAVTIGNSTVDGGSF